MPHHLNPNGTCHGGMLATFCDVLLPLASIYQSDRLSLMAPTIGLSLDFLAPTPADAWVECRADVLRVGRRMLFVQGLLTVGGVATVRADGTFSVPPPDSPAPNFRDGLRALLRAG